MTPVRLQPPLEDIVNTQTDWTSCMRAFPNVLEAIGQSLGELQGGGKEAECEVKRRNKHGIRSRLVSCEFFNQSPETASHDVAFLEDQLVRKSLLQNVGLGLLILLRQRRVAYAALEGGLVVVANVRRRGSS